MKYIMIIGLAILVLVLVSYVSFHHGIAPTLEQLPAVSVSPEGSSPTGKNAQAQNPLEKAATLQELEPLYEGAAQSDLVSELAKSKRLVAELFLVEKSNKGGLNAAETTILLTEIRRQGVISHELTKIKLAVLKDKYL